MWTPEPTDNPNTLLQNMWGSLKRAAASHWGTRATIEKDGSGYKATLETGKIPPDSWKLASKYMRGYAKYSGWVLYATRRGRGHVAFRLRPSGKTKKAPDPG